jgi:hypothetical protein
LDLAQGIKLLQQSPSQSEVQFPVQQPNTRPLIAPPALALRP